LDSLRTTDSSAERDYSTLFDLLPIGAYRARLNGVLVRANAALVALDGFTTEAQMLAEATDLAGQWYVDPQRRIDFMHALHTHGQLSGFISEVRRYKTRERIWVSEAAHIVRDAQGHALYYEGTVEDISERMRAEDALRSSENRFRALTDNARVLTLLVDEHGTIRYVSAQAQQFLGLEPVSLVGTSMYALLHPDDVVPSRQRFQEVKASFDLTTETAVRVQCSDGSFRTLGVVGANFLNDPDIGGIVLNARDIAQEVQAKTALVQASRTDPLTGLPNRLHFEALFAQTVAAANASQLQALLFIDLDRFKWVNDSLGHSVGDRVLIRVGQMLKQLIGPAGIVGRIGGDEFCVSAPVRHMAHARSVGQSITSLLEQPLREGEHTLLLGASVGLALYPDHGTAYDVLLRNADLAMFKAKSGGGSAVSMYCTEMAFEAQMRMQLATDLRSAIGAGQIDVHFQPQYLLATGELRGFEALARWRHPLLGNVTPDRFIPVAEETGQINALGRLVMDKALAQSRLWRNAGATGLRLAVNVSAQQLHDPGFADEVQQRLAAARLDPRQLEVEITESSIVRATEQTKSDLQRLRAIGVQVAIDDIGVGYSSLAYLKNLPVDVVKLDRSFINGVPHDKYDCALTRALVVLARTLEIELIAEGVETHEQARFLAELGCDSAQGYLFNRPLLPADALALVQPLHAMPAVAAE
jgi:diguanylate cyclase (GGDEF)-like protein/PAS domain S-box-containing protein